MHRVGVAEEVVQIAQDFLVRAGQEDAQDVRLPLAVGMELEARLPLPPAPEPVDHPVRVAGDVLEGAAPDRLLVEPVDRHDGEDLVDGPVVRKRLEDREVAEVAVHQRGLEVVDDLGVAGPVARDERGDRVERGEVVLLDVRHVAERDRVAREELLEPLLGEHGVVEDLVHPVERERLEVLLELHQHRGRVVTERRDHRLGEGLHVGHVDQEQGVVGGERPARLRDDVGHRRLELAAHGAQEVHHVVGVFPIGVIHAGRPGRAGALVVHPQTAAHVDVGELEPHLPDLDVVPPDLLQRRLDEADVGDLAAQVEMHQLEQLLPSARRQPVEELHQLHRAEAELGAFAAALGPPPRALGGELDPDAEVGHHAHFVGHAERGLELAHLLQHDEHLVPEPLAHQRQPHELLVLVAVADDEVVGLLGEAQHRLELRLAAALEAHAEGAAEADDLLDDVALLIDLDRVHRGVGTPIAALVDGALELGGQRGDPRVQDVGEPEQERQADALCVQIERQPVEVDRAIAALIGMDADVALGIDAEIAEAPAAHVVELLGVLDGPGGIRDRRLRGGSASPEE